MKSSRLHLRIVHIGGSRIEIPPKHYGGTEGVVAALTNAQAQLGHSVTLLSCKGSNVPGVQTWNSGIEPLVSQGITWEHHLADYPHYLRIFRQLRRLLKAGKVDVVHIHLSSAGDLYAIGEAGTLREEYPHVAFMGTLHSMFPFDRFNFDREGWGFTDHLLREELRLPLVAISASARKQALKTNPYLQFMKIILHGLPGEAFVECVSQPKGYCLWVGRITPDKGTHLAAEACIKAGIPLKIAGLVQQNEQDQLYQEERVKPLLANKLIQYIGPVNASQRMELMRRAIAFLNPIEWEEPFGLAIAESMACGLPVISFARGATPELIRPGLNGYLVNNVDEMAEAIHRVGSFNRELILKEAQKNFSARRMAEEYIELYRTPFNVRA